MNDQPMFDMNFILSRLHKTPALNSLSRCAASFIAALLLLAATCTAADLSPEPTSAKAGKIPDKLVVMTFDDSVADHATYVAPQLKKFGFGATFFITEGFNFLANKTRYLTWEQIKELNDAGFEIGNHTRNHQSVQTQSPDQIAADVAHIEQQCAAHGIPRPTSFCYPGYATSPAAVQVLRSRGYRFARAGGRQAFDPVKDDPLLMPQAFDSKPDCKFEQFVAAVAQARSGHIAVMTFHGVPDLEHPWVDTAPAKFEKYLEYLKEQGCTVVSVRDMAKYLPPPK